MRMDEHGGFLGSMQAAIPDHTGTVTLTGLDGAVEVVRDSLGIPHIRAGSVHDAFSAQGYVHAQDRLWQMEYDRRRATGRWAALTGPGGLEHDILMRRLRLGPSAQADYAAFSPATRAMFDAYAAGVNAFIETTTVLPVEYHLTETTPEPWQPWHSIAVYKVRHVLMGVWGQKLWRTRQLSVGGPEMIAKLRAGAAVPGSLIIPPGTDYTSVPDGTADLAVAVEAMAGAWDWGSGSNSWAVHGTRTASGMPLLCGDSHRALDTPSVYYQNHLVCPEFDVIGYSFGGVPAFAHFGHNARVAWCITHASADYQDLYIEKFAPNDPTRYAFRGEWLVAERHHETIAVRGAESVAIDVTVTHHGPVTIGDPASGVAVAMRYSATAGPNMGFETFLPMLSTTSVEDLDAKMRDWVDPANNFLMADTNGTIGYLTRGEIPLRSQANFWLPVPGWTGEHEWQGRIPHADLPRMMNPETGFFVTANNRIVGDDYPYLICLDFAPPHRADRITDRLRNMTGATITEMEAIHAEKRSIPSRTMVAMLDRVVPQDERAAEAKALMQAWDGTMGPESVPAAICAVWRECAIGILMEGPYLAPLVRSPRREDVLELLPFAARLRATTLALMHAGDTALLPEGATWESVLSDALIRAVAWLTERCGPEMAMWQWGRIHRTAPQHTLAATFPELKELLNPPTVGVGGDSDTPQVGGYGGLGTGDFTITGLSVNRYCFDLADWDKSGWVVPLGASGHPGSPHYADQRIAWSEQRLLPMRYSWAAVTADAAETQRLEPAGSSE
jgi:penicillin amidase